jgi:hypothetical protein
MDSAELITLGSAMFGKRWRVEVSRNLGVSTVAVHNWVHNKKQIPDTRADEVRALFAQRLKLMQMVAEENHIIP